MKELVAVSIPNLISGVSQQPHTLRLASSCSELINGWPSVVTGLSKRPPSEHIANLGYGAVPANATGYLIDREGSYRFIVVVSNDDLQIYSLDGVRQTVNFPDGKAYLSQSNNPAEDFRFVTLADTTFVLNRKVTVQTDFYGEIGDPNFTPDGVVDLVSQLPASATIGAIWKVESTDSYYQWQNTGATAAKVGWVAQGDAQLSAPFGAEVVDTLPGTATLNKVVWLRTTETITDREAYFDDTRSDNGGGIFYRDVVRTQVSYRQYKGAQTQAAKAGSNKWVKLSESQLSKIVLGRISPTGRGTVHVTNSIANTYYSVYIDGALKAQFLTKNGTDAANSVEGTDIIATGLRDQLATAGYSVTRRGSTVCISGIAGKTIYATAGQGDRAIRYYTDTVNQFSDLPPNELEGRIVRIKGSAKDNGDDYYVKYNEGIWTETFGWNQGEAPEPKSMPHVLVREADGTWTFKEHVWEGRYVGDKESNPNSSFFGTQLKDIFLYGNRLGFVADENVILSEAGNLENFYRTTMPTVVDSDPIDIAVLNSGNDMLFHAVPFNKDLLLMSDRNQYRFSYQNYLGPKNCQVNYTTSFSVSRTVRPENMGGAVYFVDDKPGYNYAKFWEYFPKDNGIGDDAEDTTAPVPEYIPTGIVFTASSARLKAMVLNSKHKANRLYLYKYYWAGERKVQNAWSYWEFPDCDRILWAGFTGNYLYALMSRNGAVYLERIKFDEAVSRNDITSRVLVDRQVQKEKLNLIYSVSDDYTIITLPYATPKTIEVIVSWYEAEAEDQVTDLRLVVTKLSDTQFKVAGNLTTADIVTCGVGYSFLYRFSPPYLRQQKGNGEVVVLDGTRLQLRYMTIEYRETAYFTTVLKYPGRADVVTYFDGKITGDASYIIGSTPFPSGKVRVPLVGNNKDAVLEIQNDSPFNCSFGAAEWSCVFMPRAMKRM